MLTKSKTENPTEDPPRLTGEISVYFSPFKLSSFIAQSVFHDKLYLSFSHFRKPRVSHKHPQCKATDTKVITKTAGPSGAEGSENQAERSRHLYL